MNAKQLKFMSLFEEMSRADDLSNASVKKYLPAFLNLDYALAVDVWDFLCTAHEDKLAKDEAIARLLGSDTLEMFYKKGSQKAVKALNDIPPVRRAVYQYSPAASEGTPFAILVELLTGAKVDAADEILKCLVRNDRIAYGPMLKNVLERLFIEILKKNPAKKIEMPRKLSSLLLTYISKIKTDERAMLEQRIRETM